jgi:hypothetical protein
LKCSSGGEGGNSPQQPLSLGEDVTIVWSAESSNRFYQSQEITGSSNPVIFESSNREFSVGTGTGRVEYEHPGTTVIRAVQRVNGISQTAQYRLTVEKADQQPLESRERITETFAPDLEFIPDVSGGSTNNQVTFERMAGPDNIVRFQENFTKLKIEGVGTVVIRAKKAGNENYNDVFSYFWLTVNKAQPWIEIGKLNEGKVITNLSDGALNIDKVFDIEVKVEQGEGETTIEVNENDFAFAYANNTQDLLSSVEIKDSKIVAKKIGRASIKVSVPESDNYFAAEKEFVLEVRPQNVEFNQQNLSSNNITKQCGQDVDVDLMIDNKPLAQALQNTGSSDDILVFASSNSSVAQVNSQTGVVTPVGKGTATISATFFGDSKLKDSYNLTVNKVAQPIEFQETGPKSIYSDEISNNSINNPIKGAQPDGSITYSIKQQDGTLFSIDRSTGEVTLDSGSELPVTYSATIVATKAGDSCYLAASANYTINLYNAIVKFPKPGDTADKEYNIQFSSSGSTSSNNIKLYYTNTPAGKFDDNSIVKPIRSPEYDNQIDTSQGSYRWDTSGLPEGNYYIIARTAAGKDTANEDCDLKGTNGCFIAENPLIIEHDHGLAMDCSAMFNYPGGYLKAPYQCNKKTLALRSPIGSVTTFQEWNNTAWIRVEDGPYKFIYPNSSFFMLEKQDGTYNEIGHDHAKNYKYEKFTQNMTIFSRDDAFIGVDEDNNIALNYPITNKTYAWEWLNDFKKYKALSSYADSKKEDLINNGSIANLIYRLYLENDLSEGTIDDSDFKEGDVFTSVVTNGFAKAALTKDGRIKVWGHNIMGGGILSTYDKKVYDSVPDLSQAEFIAIYPNLFGFSAVKTDKSVIHWGLAKSIETKYPYRDEVKSEIGDDIKKILSNDNFFFGIKNDASVKVWGEISSDEDKLKSTIESVLNIKNIYTAGMAITLEDKKGDLYWIPTDRNYENPKLEKIEHSGFDNVFTKIYSNEKAFAGITAEGRIQSWGNEGCGGTNAPSDKGYIAIYSTYCSFVAVKADGTYNTWGKMGEKTGALSPKTIMVTGTQKDVHNDLVEVSLEYDVSDGATNIRSLSLGIFYDSEKLVWKGLAKDGVLGLRDKPSSGSSNTLIKQWASRYGEFSSLADYPDDDRDFTDKNEDTKRWVFLQWNYSQDDQLRTFQDPTDEKGFIGDRELPVKLVERMSFIRQSDFVDGSTTIRFKVGKVARGLAGHEHDVSWLEKAPLIIKANPNTSNSDESDSGVVDSKVIEITPKDIQYDAENANLQFSVRYTTDTKRIPSMYLYIYYDDSKLDWNGLERSSVLGYLDPEGVNSEESTMINEDWKSTWYGEFRGIHHLYGDNYNHYKSSFERGGAFDDRDDDTKAVIVLRWMRPSTGKGTFKSGSTGFVPEIPNKLKLFQNSFKLKEGFQANESTRINFRIGDGVRDTKHGRGYPLSTTSIIIEKDNNGDVSFNSSEKETILR